MPLSSGTTAPTVSGWVSAAERGFELSGLHCEPEHVDGRNFGGAGNWDGEVSEWTFELQLLRDIAPSDSRRTTIVTGAPERARQAPIRPPTPPAPRIAC